MTKITGILLVLSLFFRYLDDLVAAHLRHNHIKENKIRRSIAKGVLQGLFTVSGQGSANTPPSSRSARTFRFIFLIIDDENPRLLFLIHRQFSLLCRSIFSRTAAFSAALFIFYIFDQVGDRLAAVSRSPVPARSFSTSTNCSSAATSPLLQLVDEELQGFFHLLDPDSRRRERRFRR